jgi:hypothetical protein
LSTEVYGIRRVLTLLPVVLLLLMASMSHGETVGIPLKPDPPFSIDGQLGDWSKVPGGWNLIGASHVTGGALKWKGNDDLSANIKLAWRPQYLYVAVDVTDDQINQTQTGAAMWKGDYVGFYVDTNPDADKETASANIFNIGLSPGNFKHTGDLFTDLSPEAYMFAPRASECPDVLVAAQRTEKGYTIEAAIPWKSLGIVNPAAGMKLGIEVMVSDCDSREPSQDKFTTIGTTPFSADRNRMIPVVLAGADGKASELPSSRRLFNSVKIVTGAKKDFNFDLQQVPEGSDAVISLLARFDTPRLAGYTPGMGLSMNGVPIDASRLVNKTPMMDARGGSRVSMMGNGLFAVWYAPDYISADGDEIYGLKAARTSQYELRVTDLLKPGQNTLEVRNGLSGITYELYVDSGNLDFRPMVTSKVKQGPPTGIIPICMPAAGGNARIGVETLADGALAVTLGKNKYVIESEYSTPAPAWVKNSNEFFTVNREIEKRDDCIIVKDTYRNLTDDNLPLMHRHTVSVPGMKKTWLAGLLHEGSSAFSATPENPTSFGGTDDAGVGLCALDDVFRVHVNNFMKTDSLGLADNNLVLKPRTSYVSEWAIVPTSTPDYWDFINTLRRLMGVNFKLDGEFCFILFRPDFMGDMSDAQLATYVENRSLKYAMNSRPFPAYKTLDMAMGPYWRQIDHSVEKAGLARWRKSSPGTIFPVYFHCFIDSLAEDAAKYMDDAMLLSDGKQAYYGGHDSFALFVPTTENNWGREIAKNIDFNLNDIGYDGIYWDEFETSQNTYHYGKPWDGVSADIDPVTMKIAQIKSSIPLISQDFRVRLARKIMARIPLIGNGAPCTRTTANLHFPRFTETGTISNCTLTHLYTPIALGDHLTERTELDCYKVMLEALDYGCVYYWYSGYIKVTHPTLTAYMYPITPIEIHEGYIIGKERIITNRSGLYGWGDKSNHEVHVFDDTGREVPGFKAPAIVKNGETFTELRIGEGWSAAIVKK